MFSNISERVFTAVLTAIILGVLALIWQLFQTGGLVSALGGVSKSMLKLHSVPQGAVVAFDQDGGCPKGWAPFSQAQSRTIVGASFNDESIAPGLSKYRHDDKGGEEAIVLTDAHLPSHKHEFEDIFYSENPNQKGRLGIRFIDVPGSIGSHATDNDNKGWLIDSETKPFGQTRGKQESIRMIQPYIALYYCKKD